MNKQLLFLIPSFIICFLIGCDSGSSSTSNIKISTQTSPKGDLSISEAEANKFALELESAIKAGDEKKAEVYFDFDIMIDEVTKDLGLNSKFIEGFRQGFESSNGLIGKIFQSTRGSGSYEFLKIRKKENGYHALFRMNISNDGGFNYHELLLGKTNGRIKTTDIYTYMTGEYITTTMRRIVVPLATHQNRSIVDRLSIRESDFIKFEKEFQSFAKAASEGRGSEALSIYNSFPQSLKEDKNCLILRIQSAQKLGETSKEYMSALDDFYRLYPKDPALDLILIDYYTIQKDYEKVVETVNRLNEAVGGDPFLATLGASFLIDNQKFDQAEKICLNALKLDPSYEDIHWTIINVYLQKNDNDAVLDSLKRMDKAIPNMTWSNFRMIPAYMGFANSPQHDQWLKYLDSK